MMELSAGNRNFIMQLQSDQIDFQPRFCVAMDSNSSKQLQNNELVFLDGIFDEEKHDAANIDGGKNDDNDEINCFIEGEEVDLNATAGIVHMRLATDIDDIDEPFIDSDGRSYYICEKCAFVCVDHATLVEHSSEKHSKYRSNQHKRQRTNNSALRSIDDRNDLNESILDVTVLNKKPATPVIATIAPSSSPSPLEPTPGPKPAPSTPEPASPLSSSFEDQKPYECEICHKRLSTKANLIGHITIHSNDKPFGCDLCSKRFKQKRHLKYHQKIHNFKNLSFEPNQVVYTDNGFAHKDESIGGPVVVQLKKKSAGMENMPLTGYQCNQCPKVYSHKRTLYRHQRIHLPVYPCNICRKQFKIENNLYEHMKLHAVADY